MQRKSVRSGRFDHRDRATKRRRDQPQPKVDHNSQHESKLWETARAFVETLGVLDRFDIKDYLTALGQIDVPLTNKMRVLAIELEEAGADWPTLETVYQSALQDNPNDIDTIQSRGISAYRIGLQQNNPALLDLAAEAFSTAAFLEPERSSSHYLMGVVAVERHEPSDQALRHFEAAIRLDPKHGWALLRKAQCLHDLHQWDEAVNAYLQVPKETFQDRNSAWRINYLLEETAYCRLQAGDMEGSRTDFETILDRYEKQPHLLDDALDTFLPAAAEAFPDLATRIAHILDTRPSDAIESLDDDH